jgi:hypothetical protein
MTFQGVAHISSTECEAFGICNADCLPPFERCGTQDCCADTPLMNSKCETGTCVSIPKCDPRKVGPGMTCTSGGYECRSLDGCGPRCCHPGDGDVPLDGTDWSCSVGSAGGEALVKCCPPGTAVVGTAASPFCCPPGYDVINTGSTMSCCFWDQVSHGGGESICCPDCCHGPVGCSPRNRDMPCGQCCIDNCCKLDGGRCVPRANNDPKNCKCSNPV